jgi:LRR receptor-like serine/threonine-protein kinase FLS2
LKVAVDGAELTGQIPTDVGLLTKMKYFDVWDNAVDGEVPESICKCVSLKTMWLGMNPLTGSIPQCIGELVLLEIFDFSVNQMTGPIPAAVSGMTAIKEMYLSYQTASTFSGVMPNLTALTNLYYFNAMSTANLTGVFPSGLMGESTCSVVPSSMCRLATDDFSALGDCDAADLP